MIPFAEAIASRKVFIIDGAMGTQLSARGGTPGPAANLNCPELVKAIHAEYKRAGAHIILTNTLTANRIALEHAGLADKIREINETGVKLARQAVGDECWVCGDMSSTGKFLEPLGDYTEEQFHDCFAEQAAILAEAGVDLIIIETMTDVREAAIAVKAAKAAAGLPVIACIAFDPARNGDYRTMMGDTVERAVEELAEAGADAIGANCGTIDPIEMSEVIARMRSFTNMVLVAEPNAGKPELAAGEVTFKLSPEEFAEGVVRCVEAGATLVGGCCGTTPAHIAALTSRQL
jgi:5-methyltetrahydrofolate--homocysteine methyltransferase